MFSELPKIFGRDFAIAYFGPSAGFVAATYFIIVWFQIPHHLFNFSWEARLQDLTAFGVAALVGAAILMVLNGRIIRVMEGYWPFGLTKSLNYFERNRYQKLIKRYKRVYRKGEKFTPDVRPLSLQDDLSSIRQKMAEEFPEEALILPTSFGNIFRAFEVYPRLIYGIDAIPGWYRLLAVIPEDYRNLMDAAKGRVDLWVNVSVLATLLAIEFFAVAIWTTLNRGTWPAGKLFLFPASVSLLAYIGYRFAKSAATEWGYWVRSAFDLFLPELRKKLEFPAPSNNEEERNMWRGFTLAALYRDEDEMPEKTRTSS